MKIVFAIIEQGHFRQGLIYKANRMWTPYSTAIMAAVQRQNGHTVKIFDANACAWDNYTLSAKIIGAAPDIVVLMTQPCDRWQNPYPTIEQQKSFVQVLRKKGFENLVLAVGPHPTLLPENFLHEIPEVDYIIRGEPESGVDEFIRRIAQSRSFEGVPGLSARVMEDIIHFGEEERVTDLAQLPMPAYDLLPMDKYRHHFYSQVADPTHRFAFIETNRGCPFGCNFCNLSLYGKKVRRFPVQRILSEIDLLVSEYKVNYLFFGDLSFAVHRKDAEHLLHGLIERRYNLRWSCQTRIDLLDADLLNLMSRAGCHRIEAGIETAQDGLLEKVKRVKTEQLVDLVDNLKNMDIKLESGHLIGLPNQTVADIWKSARFLKRLGIRFKITSVTVPYPGTVDYELGVKEGKIDKANWTSIVAAAGTCGNNLTPGKIHLALFMVQCLYYGHIFGSGMRTVLSSLPHLRAAWRGLIRLFYHPRDGAGAIKRTFEDAVYGAE
ncbi:radical SAM protein [candidate division KSB1 bacterium]|nr:radical SAM protein [candidate division KSB1 bacterium]